MTQNPIYNALLALGYVALIVFGINIGSEFATEEPKDNLLMPIGMLSLFVLSAAVMSFLFFYQPVLMLFEGKRKEAVRLFLGTVAAFAVSTICVLVAAFILIE